MMKVKRVLALLLCLALLLTYAPMRSLAAEGTPNIVMSINKEEVQPGDTITVVLSYNDMYVKSFGAYIQFDLDKLTCTSVTGARTDKDKYKNTPYLLDIDEEWVKGTSLSNPDKANANGQVGFAYGSTEDWEYMSSILFTATFVVKDDATGTLTFGTFEDSNGPDGYQNKDADGENIVIETQTVTIIGSTEPAPPECEHTETKLVPNGDGTHNVVCTNTECNHVVTENVPCSGTDDGEHTTAVMCACGNIVTAATEHTYTQNRRGSLKDAGDCETVAVYYVLCDNCDYENKSLTVDGEKGDHNYGELIDATEEVHNKETLAPSVDAHYQCTECDKYFDKDKNKVEYEDLLGEKPQHTVVPSQTTTVTTKEPTCTEEGTESVSTFCSCGYAFDVYTQPIPAVDTAHNWNTPTYSWSADGKTCTATRICKNNEEHKEEETVTGTPSVTTVGTCQTAEVVTYTADFTSDWAEDQTNEVTGKKNPDNHENLVRTAEDPAECDYSGLKEYWYCSDCGKFFADADAQNEIEDWQAWSDEGGKGYIPATGHGKINGFRYVPNVDPINTHTVYCKDCGLDLNSAEPHNFDNEAHKCLCGKVEEFTLTVNVRATGELVELTVPYGANLLEVLSQAVTDGKIPAIGDQIRYNDVSYNGYTHTSGYSYWDETAEKWIYDLEGLTMPAADFAVDQDYEFYNGWSFYYDGNDEYVGAEFLSEEGYLTGWNYIEEDYDDVEGGAWYYFYEGTGDRKGWYFRAEGLTRALYPVDDEGNPITINGNTYAPDADAVASDPDFIDATEAWFMFGDDGKFQYDAKGIVGNSKLVNGMLAWHPGLIEIPGSSSYHYFLGNEENGGNIGADGDVWVTRIAEDLDREFVLGGIYTFEDSKLCEYTGITEVGGKLRFYGSEGADENRLMAGNGLTKVGENFIYVRSNGELVVNADYYVPTNDKGIVPGTYHFDENGFLVNPELTTKNGIVAENGGLFFYENGKIAYNKGLIQYNGGIIYVRSNGQLAVGEYYVTNLANFNGNDVKYGDKVTFGDDGYMVAAKNGIVDGLYYIDNQIAYNAGVVQLENGKYIYVKSNGTVVMNTNYWITNVGDTGVVAKLYSFDANGYFTPEFAADQKDGIVDGYYYVDGKIAYGAGLIYLEDEGCYIYVRSNGQLATGIYWPTATNGYDFSGRYDFGADGKLYI